MTTKIPMKERWLEDEITPSMITYGVSVAKAYNPDQPRAPKGSDNGGQWTSRSSSLIENHKGFVGNPSFSAPQDYIIVAHVTNKQNTESILKEGLVLGRHGVSAVATVGDDNNIWFWRDTNKSFENWQSKKESVIFIAVPSDVWKDPSGISLASAYNKSIPPEHIYGIISND